MKVNEIISIIQGKNYVISDLVIKSYKSLGITSEEFILIIYLINNEKVEFDPHYISKELNISINEVLTLINNLLDKKVVEIIIDKENNKISKEYISLDLFYNKLVLGLSTNKEEQSDLYSIFEREFGRTISPTEYQIIASWLEQGYLEEVILLALKESIYNGVKNLKYIDRILYNWSNKGIKTKEDVEKQMGAKKEKEAKAPELFDYNWIDEK